MKEILPCLRVKKKDPSSLHGWLYEDWLKVIDDDPFAEVAAVSITTAANTAADDVLTEPNSEAPEVETSISSPLAQDEETSIFSPLGQVLHSLDDISFQNPTPDNRIQHTPFSLLQMFPPAEEEMAWDNSTTPPAILKISEEDADDELNSALTKTKLFDTDDDFVDNSDLTSQDSDDVFFDESILEVSLNGRRKFSRGNPARKQIGYRKKVYHDNSNQDEVEQGDADDEFDEELDEQENDDHAQDLNASVGNSRSRRQEERLDYALLHSTGRKKGKKLD